MLRTSGPRRSARRDRVRTVEVDAREQVVAFAGDERALGRPGWRPQAVGAAAAGQPDRRDNGRRFGSTATSLVRRIRGHDGDPEPAARRVVDTFPVSSPSGTACARRCRAVGDKRQRAVALIETPTILSAGFQASPSGEVR